MGNHSEHQDHHSDEKKPVAFTVPLIFGSVIVFIIVLLVSLGDPKSGCECKETCSKECREAHENGDHSKCEEEMEIPENQKDLDPNKKFEEKEDTMTAETVVPSSTTDSTQHSPKNETEHH